MMPACHRIAVVAIGNPLAGDDGAGPAALELLRRAFPEDPRLHFLCLEADLFALADHVARAGRFLFLDALAGEPPGRVLEGGREARAFAPSLHQADLAAVIRSLETLEGGFPPWELWGVTIRPPSEYRLGLSPEVASAVEELAGRVGRRLRELLGEGRPTPITAKLSVHATTQSHPR